MEKYILHFREISKSSLSYAGGKGANLGEMTRAGFPVPQGFCVTTHAYKALIETSKEMDRLFGYLENISHDDLKNIGSLGGRIREHMEGLIMPEEIKSSIIDAWEACGEKKAYAVRSSATAEDLPSASFAGQQDTYLNICGEEQLLKAVQKCWASLFTDRAISYRAKNGFSHRSVYLSVVVQEMVFPEVSGIMFTADPVSGNRRITSIDASFGLGEALVSGLVTADLYQVRSGKIIKKEVSNKKIAIYSIPEGGTETKDLPKDKQDMQALPDERIIELSNLGRKIEAHYGSEQDIEWGFAGGKFYVLQSRPITSLYPVPHVTDGKFRVFMSFGHIQMMTDTMKPLAISLFSNITNFLGRKDNGREVDFVYEAGGRMFADVTGILSLKPVRERFLKIIGGMDELLSSAMSEAVKCEEFKGLHIRRRDVFHVVKKMVPVILPAALKVIGSLLFKDPEKIRVRADSLIDKISEENEKKIIEAKGAERINRIKEGFGNMLPDILAKVVVYMITGILAAQSLEKKLKKKVGDERCASLLSMLNKSLPGNVTAEMGLKAADLADIARKWPEVVDYLKNPDSGYFYDGLLRVHGGREFKGELDNFLAKYGMRCSGEIDITKQRWNEDPLQLVPSIVSNILTVKKGEHREKYRQGEIEARQAEDEILSLYGHFEKRRVSRLVRQYRNLMGLREHHKFAVIILFDIYKHGILEESEDLVKKGILKDKEDIFYFTLDQVIGLLEGNFSGDAGEHIESIKKQYERYKKLTPPRVITSNGEIIAGSMKNKNAPEGALKGLPVSAGVIEGTARVILRLEDARLNPGEILVAPYTDPGWTPLFTSSAGLITEVGGMMTHGSVIAREYGIPAVVGIDKATEIIKDGSHIRVNGTEGYVEIL